MNILNDLFNWGKNAWNALTGLPGDIAQGIASLWHYVNSVHNVLSWIVGIPQLRAIQRFLYAISIFHVAQIEINRAFSRVIGYIWVTMVRPLRNLLLKRIAQLRAWTAYQIHVVYVVMGILYRAALAYTRQQVGIERAARIKAIQAEHAAMLKAVAACLATVQRQASSGYNAGLHDRLGTIGKLLNDLADRNPAVQDVVKTLVGVIFDLESVDNPVVRFIIGKLLGEIVAKAGVDRITGSLISRLLGDLTGQVKASGLYDTALDISNRLNALEDQWAEFMTNGGPEVEQAGQEWKALTELSVDAAVLGVFALAVADPSAWATGVADTIGTVGNDTVTAVVDLLNRA